MTKQEIKTELENAIYLLQTLENDYVSSRLKLVLKALSEEWNDSDYYSEQINKVLNFDETMENLNNIKIK